MNKSFYIVSISSALLGVTPFLFSPPFQSHPINPAQVAQGPVFRLVDVKMAMGADENRNPVDVTNEFPAGTEKIYAAFTWENAESNLQVVARWYYTSEDIHILDSSFTLTRRSEKGVTTLTMQKANRFLLEITALISKSKAKKPTLWNSKFCLLQLLQNLKTNFHYQLLIGCGGQVRLT